MEKFNEIIEIEITDISDMGQGIGRLGGQVVFVDGALPGDLARAKITQKKKNFSKGRAIELLESSSSRFSPVCPQAKECGGCGYMELDYKKQLEIKEQHLKDKLERIAGITDVDYEPIVYMEKPLYYRNKTEFTVSKDGEIGFNKQGSNEIIDISKCYISSPVANTILEFLKPQLKKNCLGISKVTIRTSFSTGETMVILGTEMQDADKLVQLIEEMDDAVNEMETGDFVQASMESVYIYNPARKKNPYTLIAGNRTIKDEMMGLKFEISPASFYQTNPLQTVTLFKNVGKYAGLTGREKVFDLYCGVGSIGLTLADSAKEVWGVESVKDAVIDANRNAVINGVINARYVHGKAEEMMDQLGIDKKSIIFLDPPRAGCKPEVLNAISNSKSDKIIYISCDPATFARDVKLLESLGFTVKKITPVDMFPQTTHLEIVSLLER